MKYLAGVAAACVWIVAAFAADEIAGRATVIDGDTLEIHGTKIRLHGIDAVESSQTCTRSGESWPCGRKAAFALADFIGSQTVRCDRKDTDRYERVVAVCSVGSTDLNAWMVQQGWAVAYTQYSKDYVGFEEEARQAQRNIWNGDFVRPQDWRHGKNAANTGAPLTTTSPSPTAKPSPSTSTGYCCKHCSKGKPCGNSCIARNKTCRQPPGCAC